MANGKVLTDYELTVTKLTQVASNNLARKNCIACYAFKGDIKNFKEPYRCTLGYDIIVIPIAVIGSKVHIPTPKGSCPRPLTRQRFNRVSANRILAKLK